MAYNIPLDAKVMTSDLKKQRRKQIISKLRYLVAAIGPVIALISLAISPSWLNVGLLVLHLVFYWLFGVLIKPKKVKKWGLVYDAETKRPVKNAVVRLFDLALNKMVAVQVTNSKGRYGKQSYRRMQAL